MSSAKSKMSAQVAEARARMMQLPQGSAGRKKAMETYTALKAAYNAAFTIPPASAAVAAKPKPVAAPAKAKPVAVPAKTNGTKAVLKPGTAVGPNAVVIKKKSKILSEEDMQIDDAESIDGPSDGEEDAVDPEEEEKLLKEEGADFALYGSDEEREDERIADKQHAFRVGNYMKLSKKGSEHAIAYLRTLSAEAQQAVLSTVNTQLLAGVQEDTEEVTAAPEDSDADDADYVPPADEEEDEARELPDEEHIAEEEEVEAPAPKKPAVTNGKPKKPRPVLADDDEEEAPKPAPKPVPPKAAPKVVPPKPVAKPVPPKVVPPKPAVTPKAPAKAATPKAAAPKPAPKPAPKAPVHSAAAAIAAMQADEEPVEEPPAKARKPAKKRSLPEDQVDEADDEEETKGKRSRKKAPASDRELEESYAFSDWTTCKYVSRHAGLSVKAARITPVAAITSRKSLRDFSKWFADTIGTESETTFAIKEDFSNIPSCFAELFTFASDKEAKLVPGSKGSLIQAHLYQSTDNQPVVLPIHHATHRMQESLFFPLLQSSPVARVMIKCSSPLENAGTLDRDVEGRVFGIAPETQFYRLPPVKDTPLLFQLSALDRQNRFSDPEQTNGVPETSVVLVDGTASDPHTPFSDDDFREKVGVFKFVVFTWEQTRVRPKKNAPGDDAVSPPAAKRPKLNKPASKEPVVEDDEATDEHETPAADDEVVEETVEQEEEEVLAPPPAAVKAKAAAAAAKPKPKPKPAVAEEAPDDVDVMSMQVDVAQQNQSILRAQIAKMQATKEEEKEAKEEEEAPASPTSRDFSSGAEVPLADDDVETKSTASADDGKADKAKQTELMVCLCAFPDEARKTRVKEYYKNNVVPFATLNAKLVEPDGADEQKRNALLADVKAFIRTLGGIDGPSGRMITWTSTHGAFVLTPRDGTRTFFVEVSMALAARLLTAAELQPFKPILGKPRVCLTGERVTVVKVTHDDPISLDEIAKFVSDTKNLELDVPRGTPKAAVVV